jgi:nitric oxide reductase large subunit
VPLRAPARFHTLEWVRIGGDMVFLLAGVVPILAAAVRSLARRDAPRVPETA